MKLSNFFQCYTLLPFSLTLDFHLRIRENVLVLINFLITMALTIGQSLQYGAGGGGKAPSSSLSNNQSQFDCFIDENNYCPD